MSPHRTQAPSPTVAGHLGENIWNQDAHLHPLLLSLIQALPVLWQPPLPAGVPPLLNPSAWGSTSTQTHLQYAFHPSCKRCSRLGHEKAPAPRSPSPSWEPLAMPMRFLICGNTALSLPPLALHWSRCWCILHTSVPEGVPQQPTLCVPVLFAV